MKIKELYESKVITVEDSYNMVKSGDHIVSGLAASEPKEFLSNLHTLNGKVKDVHVLTCLPMLNYEYFMKPEYLESFIMEGWFYSGTMRRVHKQKSVTYIPNHLHFAGKRRISYKKPNIFIGNCTPMDQHGFVSIGFSDVYEKEMIESADLVILEVNPNVPRTFGDTNIHITEVDYFIETNYSISELPVVQPSEKDMIIGKYIADIIEDRSTIQIGIGGIPNAVTKALINKKNLGIHTEMLTDGMVDLFESGVITNKYKTLHKGKFVAAFALGSQKLYDFINDNPGVLIMNGSYVNDPHVIAKNDNMVSINTAIEIDLTGQVCSESLGSRHFSGTGGQADTAIGAQSAKNGKSFIALYSTANVRIAGSDKKVKKSKIVPTLSVGAGVTLSRNDVDYVVTEYGIAKLSGASIRERVKLLISISHPDFRDELQEKADQLMLW